jgi:genome maintenance exonuclease 1
MMDEKDIEEYHNIGKSIKFKRKYDYHTGKQINDNGSRIYDINGYRLPSVTTILGATKDKSFLTKWKARVGEAEAERIKNHSSSRGTAMHKFLEHYILGTGYDDLTRIGQEAKPMAEKVIEVGLAPVEEWYGSEVMLHYPGLMPGS